MNVTIRQINLGGIFAIVIAGLVLNGCQSGSPKPAQQATTPTARILQLTEEDQQSYQLAIAALGNDKTDHAAAALTKITDKHPGYLDAWINLAFAHYQLNRFQEAQSAAAKAQALAPHSAEVDNLQGLIYVALGQYKLAETSYQAALKSNPQSAHTHYNLALLYDVYYQDIQQALVHYELYLSLISAQDPATEAWRDELKRTLLSRNSP